MLTLEFYQNLGKLFYAIAVVDNNIRDEELDKLKQSVKKVWLTSHLIDNMTKTDVEDSIINTFRWLQQDNEYDAETCFNSFVSFKKENERLFTNEITSLIIKTAEDIAYSFSGINKGELILLTKLKFELNKTLDAKYYFTTKTNENFDDVEAKLMSLLNNEGFGVITQIDMQQTLKNKLKVNFKKYKILGACNPDFAYKALQVEDKIGTMLPCNIILQETAPNIIEVSAINPLVSMQAVKNEKLKTIARNVGSKLEHIINNVNNEK